MISKFQKFILYDPRSESHQAMQHRRIEFDGWYFLRGVLKPEDELTIEAHFNKTGQYPIGVGPKGLDVSDCYIPARGEAKNQEETLWIARAENVRMWADYDDAAFGDWPTPQLIPGAQTTVPTFDPNWLPISIRPWVTDVAHRMSVPVDFAAIGALCTLAGAVGARVQVFPKKFDKEWREVITLSGAVIASSGMKKTPTWNALMAPLYELEKEWDRKQTAVKAKYDADAETYNEAKRLAKKAAKDGNVSELPPLPPMPIAPPNASRLVLNDSTPEKMHLICAENPRGLLYYRDELSGWASELEIEGRQSARSFFLDGMTGDHEHTVDRIGREGGSALLTFSVFGSFQPVTFVKFLSEAKNVGSGMLPRFHLIVWPNVVKREAEHAVIDQRANLEAKELYRQVVRNLANLGYKSVHLHFDAQAQVLLDATQVRLEKVINAEKDEGMKSHLSKYRGALPKLAALFQLIDLVGGKPLKVATEAVTDVDLETGKQTTATVKVVQAPVMGDVSIDVRHFQMAQRVFDYLVHHMHRVYGAKQNDQQYKMTRLLEHIRAGELGDGFTARDVIRRDWQGLGQKATTVDAIEGALEDLEKLGWVRYMPPKPGTVGRPTKKWKVHPRICTGQVDEELELVEKAKLEHQGDLPTDQEAA